VSKLIGTDISRILAQNHPDQINNNNKSNIHFINNKIYYQKTLEKILTQVPSNNGVDNYSDIPRIRPTSAEIILRQINNNRISFDYLFDNDLQLFLTGIFSTIHNLYTISNVHDSLNAFTQLIVGQSVFALRQCPLIKKDSLSSQPCLAVSTLFLWIPAGTVSTFSVYRLISLPVIFNNDKYIYSNLPKVIGINPIDQTVITWNDDLAIDQCTFSPIILCKHRPVIMSLSKSSCLSQLFDDNQLTTSMCEVRRSQNIEQNVLDIDDGVWLFYNVNHPTYCQVYSNINGLPEIISIREAAVVRMTCDKTITCSDFQLPTTHCKEKRVIIIPSLTFNAQGLSNSIVPIKNMTQTIVSSYHVQLDKSINEWMTISKLNQSKPWDVIREFAMHILSFISFIFIVICLYIIKLLRYTLQKETTKIQSQIRDIIKFSFSFRLYCYRYTVIYVK